MARPPDTTPATVSDERLRWLRGQLASLGKDITAARKSKSWQAVASLRREARTLRDQLDRELTRQAETQAKASAVDPASLTPEEWTERHLAMALEASDDDLELYVAEWARRQRYDLVVEAGEARLVRQAS